MRRKKEVTRKIILDAAYVLFHKRGFTRVNVDEIADAAGITKRTLYSHFESKDALLESVLEAQHEFAYAAFQTFGRKLSGNPREIISAYFKELVRYAGKPRYPGPGFTRIAMELGDLPGHPARRIASQHKRLLEHHFAELLASAGHADAGRLARQIWILTEGVLALVLIHGDMSYCTTAEEAALALMDQAAEIER